MPNWCENKLTIKGLENELFAFKNRARGVGPCYKDPKWELEQKATNSKIAEEVEPDEIEALQFHSLVPVPQYLQARTYGGEEEATAAGLEWGPSDSDFCGYNWESANWGCKWGAAETRLSETADRLIYNFDTPWGPPIPFLVKASKLFPALNFRIEFEEPGMCFAGFAVVQDGEVVDSEEREFVCDEDEEPQGA